MYNYVKIKKLLTIAITLMAVSSANIKSSSAQTLPNFGSFLRVNVITFDEYDDLYFCLDQNPYELFDPAELADATAVFPWDIPSDLLIPQGIIDLNKDGQVNGTECDLYGGMYDNNPPGPYLGPQNNGVIPIPGVPPGATFDPTPNYNPLL